MRLRHTVFVFFLLVGLSLSAKDYRAGTMQQFTTALGRVAPGDTITLRGGTWTDAYLQFTAMGTAERPIVLRAEKRGGVLLTGNSRLAISGDFLVVDGLTFTNGSVRTGAVISFRGEKQRESNYCRLTNTSILNYNPENRKANTKWISLYGTHNRVDHCALTGKTNLGTTLVVWVGDAPNYHQIDSNYFGPRPELGENGGESIRVGTGAVAMENSFSLVCDNLFEQCDGEIEIISNKSRGNVYRHNTFLNCRGTLTLRNGKECVVEGNYFFGNHHKETGGIRIIGEDHRVYNNYLSGLTGTGLRAALAVMNGTNAESEKKYRPVVHALIAHNTLIDNVQNITIGAGADEDRVIVPVDCLFANNLVYGTVAPLVTFAANAEGVRWEGNIFYGAETGFKTLPPLNRIVDPQMTEPDASGVCHLSKSSPAIGGGVVLSEGGRDITGQSRDGKPDNGAEEYPRLPGFPGPVARTAVGPGE